MRNSPPNRANSRNSSAPRGRPLLISTPRSNARSSRRNIRAAAKALTELAQTESLPTEDQLRDLWEIMVQEIAEQAKVTSYPADVVQADGAAATATVTRIGPYVAFSNGRYLTYSGGNLKFLGASAGRRRHRGGEPRCERQRQQLCQRRHRPVAGHAPWSHR